MPLLVAAFHMLFRRLCQFARFCLLRHAFRAGYRRLLLHSAFTSLLLMRTEPRCYCR